MFIIVWESFPRMLLPEVVGVNLVYCDDGSTADTGSLQSRLWWIGGRLISEWNPTLCTSLRYPNMRLHSHGALEEVTLITYRIYDSWDPLSWWVPKLSTLNFFWLSAHRSRAAVINDGQHDAPALIITPHNHIMHPLWLAIWQDLLKARPMKASSNSGSLFTQNP